MVGGVPPGRDPSEDGCAGLPAPDWARVFDAAPAPFLLLTPDLVIVSANEARLTATATTLGDTVGRHLFEVFPLNPDDPAADGIANLGASLALARDTGRPVTMAIQKYDIPMPDGSYEERFWAPRNVPITDDEGRVVLLLHRSDDVTDYVRARDEARQEAARGQDRVEQVESDLYARTRELEQANVELRASVEREQRTARALAGLATTVSALAAAESVPELLELLFAHGREALQTEAAAVALLPAGGGDLRLTGDGGLRTGVLPADSPAPMAVAAAGRRVLTADSTATGTAPPLPGVRAWAALPLRAGGRLLGSWTVGWSDPRPLADDDVRVLEAYAAQCAQAVDRVTRLEDERRRASATRSLAESLQRSLLTDPPQPDHLSIAVRYRPAAQEAQVGGDWYDAFVSRDGATTLVVGDVTGHDRTAAAGMAQLRNLLRGIAHAVDSGPAGVLGALDRAVHDLQIATLATAVLARVEQDAVQAATGERSLRWSNAGHPPPLLLPAAGSPLLLERPRSLLLGVDPDASRTEHVLVLHPGDTLVLYTDGLVERRDSDLDEGLDRLVTAGSELAGEAVDTLADELLRRLVPEADDDVALLVLRVGPQDG
ncbi:SpoIIE family protein phosphatase [Modestobacter sp. L9-4]|uniref:SpoIIE family protein phosphatase n=1 Tax=Modestobacter sp. L9-4 TaxID=2851567 RepID=UPI001C7550C7|nr:SpoIIE family protein phosphatase [Modestobacter sp. L9-4]QXG76917.1 SpoIIE family protein phosphatase [Modestobacter sp. L9-4]